MPLGWVNANVTCSQSLPRVRLHTHTRTPLQDTVQWLLDSGTMSDISLHLPRRSRSHVINSQMSSEGCSDWCSLHKPLHLLSASCNYDLDSVWLYEWPAECAVRWTHTGRFRLSHTTIYLKWHSTILLVLQLLLVCNRAYCVDYCIP